MRNAERDITLYNYRFDPETGYDACTRHYIQGVSVFGSLAVNVSKEGFASADLYTIRVPESRGTFEFQEGDMIVLGEAAETNPRPAELEKKYTALTVISCTDNRGKRGGHWKVVCR